MTYEGDAFRRKLTEPDEHSPNIKLKESCEIADQVAEFLKKGGKIEEVVPGDLIMDASDMRTDKYKTPISGHAGIRWSTTAHQWEIRTPDNQKKLGYKETVIEGLAMQRQYRNRSLNKHPKQVH